MSAYLDKSQGITFVYSNIYKLYKRAKEANIDAPLAVEREQSPLPQTSSQRVIKEKDAVKVEAFEAPKLDSKDRPFAVPMGVKEAEERAMKLRAKPIADLRKNLNELTDAHERLRFLLKELEALTKKS